MIKWFILAFLSLLYAVLTAIWIDDGTSTDARIAVFIGSHLLTASLLSFWLAAYVRKFENTSLQAQGVAWLILAAGTTVTGMGVHGLLTASCAFLADNRRSGRGYWFKSIVKLAEETGTCGILSWVLLAVGLGILWKGIRLLLDIRR